MKDLLTLALVLVACSMQANTPNTKVDFIQGSLSLAVQKAGNEGKLLFVEFGAKWCMPCRFMEENTFRDKEVVSYINDNYVPVKIDIDDFDGFAYKQKYLVQALPTFLVFNSTGQVIGRYEESMAPSNLMNVLRAHNTDINRLKVSTELDAYEIEVKLHEAQKDKLNVSPYAASPIPEVDKTAILDSKLDDNSNPFTNTDSDSNSDTETSPTIKEMLSIESSDELLWEEDEEEMDYELLEVPAQSSLEVEIEEEAPVLGELEELEEIIPQSIFYTVKIGSFANKISKDEFIKATSSIFVEDTHIFEYNRDGLINYDVCLGAFASANSAADFIDRLSLLNISGEIKRIDQ